MENREFYVLYFYLFEFDFSRKFVYNICIENRKEK